MIETTIMISTRVKPAARAYFFKMHHETCQKSVGRRRSGRNITQQHMPPGQPLARRAAGPS